jgi:hypothetical protein
MSRSSPNPYIVSQLVFRTNDPGKNVADSFHAIVHDQYEAERKHQYEAERKHQEAPEKASATAITSSLRPSMRPIRDNADWWSADGRAKNGHGFKLVMRFFHGLCNNVADQCKFIVHSHNDGFYQHAKMEFDDLTKDPAFTQRIAININKKSKDHTKFGATVITYYRTGRHVAHYFLRVFRHSVFLETIVLQYHRAAESAAAVDLQAALKMFLEDELQVFDRYQRLSCEKTILRTMIQNQAILKALHNTLLEMGSRVVLLYWCCEWKNQYLFFFHKHGPCFNLLNAKQRPGSPASTTPTLQLHGVHCQITSIFDRNMCNCLARILLQDWVWLIQASYDGILEQHLNYMQTGQDVDLKILAKDLVHYGNIYKKLQDAYSNTRFCDITYKWDPPAPAVMPNVPRIQSTQACFAMHNPDTQLSTLETGTDDEAELDDADCEPPDDWSPRYKKGDWDKAEREQQQKKDAHAALKHEDERDGGEGATFAGNHRGGGDDRPLPNTWNPKKTKKKK